MMTRSREALDADVVAAAIHTSPVAIAPKVPLAKTVIVVADVKASAVDHEAIVLERTVPVTTVLGMIVREMIARVTIGLETIARGRTVPVTTDQETIVLVRIDHLVKKPSQRSAQSPRRRPPTVADSTSFGMGQAAQAATPQSASLGEGGNRPWPVEFLPLNAHSA
jgi:hypothetical protein